MQDIKAVLRIGAIDVKCFGHNGYFFGQPFIGNVSAPAGDFGCVFLAEGGDNGGADGGVGNAHFSRQQTVKALGDEFFSQHNALFQCVYSLLCGHGRPLGNVIGTCADTAVNQPRNVIGGGDAEIGYEKLTAAEFGKGIGRGTLTDEVAFGHLQGGFLGIGADTFAGHAVAGTADDSAFVRGGRLHFAGNGDIAQQQILEFAQGLLIAFHDGRKAFFRLCGQIMAGRSYGGNSSI